MQKWCNKCNMCYNIKNQLIIILHLYYTYYTSYTSYTEQKKCNIESVDLYRDCCKMLHLLHLLHYFLHNNEYIVYLRQEKYKNKNHILWQKCKKCKKKRLRVGGGVGDYLGF